LTRDLGVRIPIPRLQDMFHDNERTIFNAAGGGAIAGHLFGISTPKYEKYQGNNMLYHMTGPTKLRRMRREGLKRMKRQFIHLTNDLSRIRPGRDQAIAIRPAALRQAHLYIYKTKHPNVFLCPGPIPTYLLNFGLIENDI